MKTQVHDIQAEEVQQDSLGPDEYKMFFSLIPHLACICSTDGTFQQVSPAWEETLGYARDEIVGRNFIEFVHPDDRAGSMAEMARQGGEYRTSHFINRYLCKDGRIRWFEWNAATEKGDIYAIARDVTERVDREEALAQKERQYQEIDRINEELRKSQELLQSIINGTADSVFAKDLEGRYLLLNEKGAAAVGRTAAEVLGNTDDYLFNTKDARLLQDNDLIAVTSRTSVTVQESVRDTCGREITYLTTKGPLFDKDGNVNGTFGVARNITELVQAQEALLANQEQLRALAIELSLVEERERRRIAAELHDEIGQNLALVKIKLQDLLLGCRMAASCSRSVKELAELIEKTIQEVRTLTFQISPPLLYEVGFEAAIEWLAEQFEDKHDLQILLDHASPPMQLDEELSSTLYHVVRELLVNAVKHADAKRVVISLRRVGSRIGISVQDDGRGFQAGNVTAVRGRLGGFGLFNIRQRIQHLGGELDIASSPGSGTCVSMDVPLASPETPNEVTGE